MNNTPDKVTHSHEGLGKIEEVERLKYIFISKSKYMPIWVELKRHNKARIVIELDSFDTIRKAVSKLKENDFGFKSACFLSYGYLLHLEITLDENKSQVFFQLIDRKNKGNLINLD